MYLLALLPDGIIQVCGTFSFKFYAILKISRKKNKSLPTAVIILSIHTKKELLFSGSNLHNWLPMDWKILNFMIKTQGPTAGQREIKTENGSETKTICPWSQPKKSD